ncbi:MAG TPA: serine hydrolase domain-containing protein [Thermoanaerobaculia bacterium]|nr:serine hydrolase domain-containing protein [Thermoanaerobaculia bacterium]
MAVVMRLSILLACSFLAACATQRAIPPQLEPVRAECARLVASGKMPSIAIAVAQNGRVIWEEAFGKQATVDTMYTLASTGKSITGTAIGILAERGRIDLDAPADRYLAPQRLTVYEGDPNRITVRSLLKMGVDIPHLWWHHWQDETTQPLTNAEIVRRYAIVTGPADGGFYYSNTTFGVLAQIVENVSHRPFAEFVEREIFQPLAMEHSSLRPDARFAAYLANASDPYWYSDPEGAAGYRASIDDLIHYAMFHLGDHVAGQKAILSPAMLAAIHDMSVTGYRFGWGVIDDESGLRTAIANGGIVGASSCIRLLPSSDIAVAVLCNAPGRTVDALADHAISALVPRYLGKMIIPPQFEERPYRPDPQWEGTWTGEVKTWEGSTPVQMTFAGASVTMSAGSGAMQPLSEMREENGFVEGTCGCTVALSDTHGEPSDLELALRRDGDRLFGSARIVSTATRTNFSLPAYIELKKGP